MNQFFPRKNEETTGHFIPNKIESKSELPGISIKEVKAEDILCSYGMFLHF